MSSDYLDLFRSEAREHINHIQQILLDLEEQPEDPNLCKELLQILHTLKGDANLVNKKHIANLAHGLEDTIKEVQAGRLSLRKSGFVLISQKVELLSDFVEAPKDPPDLEDSLQTSLNQLQQLNQGILATTRMILRPSIEDLYEEVPKSFNLREAEDQEKPSQSNTIPKTSAPKTPTQPAPNPPTKGILGYVTPPPGLPHSVSSDLLPYSESAPDTSDFLPSNGKSEGPPSTNSSPAVDPSAPRGDTNSLRKPRSDSKLYHSLAGQESLRISMKKIDDLIDLMGEIAIIKDKLENKLWQSSKILEDLKHFSLMELYPVVDRYNQFYDEFSQDVTALELVTNELKIQSVDVKMIPLSTILTESYTLVRNKSLEMGKNVAPLQVIGGETKVDKSLLESLRKMLIHLILNSLAHGIEPESERVKQGKSPSGTLRISAFTRSDTILIEVEDDGRGLNAEILKKKALEKQLITPEEAVVMTDKDAFYLITKPGFSTAEKITQDSGRGVGMDVVYSTIQRLKGNLIIESEVNRFTRISMAFPVNLSLINAFFILVQKNVLVVPLNYVKETYLASRDELKTEGGLTILKRDGQKDVPVISLARYLKYPESKQYQEQFLLLILHYQNEEIAVSIDRFLRIQEIIVKPLTGALKEHKIVAGATILRTGEPAVILNIATLFHERKRWYHLRLPLEQTKEPLARCLVVDNSEMSLLLFDSILREANYLPTLASSLKMAQERFMLQSIDLVLSNITIDYKETGGIELMRWIRERKPTQKVVLISNTSSKEIIRLCYQQGADLYFCKRGFQSQDFLNKVQQLLGNKDV